MNVREKRTEEYLKARGYIVQTVTKPSRFMQHDYFGLFDHIVVRGENASKFMPLMFFVQTKSRKIYGKDKKQYEDFPVQSYCFTWVKEPNGRYTLKVYDFKQKCFINPESF